MNLTDLKVQRQALRSMLERLERITPSCVNCEHFSQGHCEKYQQPPPSEVIKTGCPEWEFDGIPF